ncbi:hypothetical protein L1049_024876 [Liquidambar formosana]|uniref:RING-type E3 ubiquitin transferase n=1 Tax=Liquidambar formosana TaxID=63359 RepID=A0AAP0S1Q3_LIQFO
MPSDSGKLLENAPKACTGSNCIRDDCLPPPPPSHVISTNLVITSCVLGSAFLLVAFCILVLTFYSRWRNSRMRNSPILDETHEDFLDEDHGPVMDHPIWFITTIGLQQSVIDSITMFKYKKEEGLIEGTECSVCLSEFQEDEALRLLPKCSHAFHLPCIDTWLRSHKNCPLCRAPIVSDATGGHVSAVEPNSSDLGSREQIRIENFQNYGGLGSLQEGEGGTSGSRVGDDEFGALPNDDGEISEILKQVLPYFNARNGGCRVQSDLADNRRVGEEELQPVRRSVSMDSSSASVIYRAMANIRPEEHEGTSDSHSGKVKRQDSEIVATRGSASSSIYRLIKSSSFGHLLQKGPISMKRSFSSGRKPSSSRHSRSRNSILPL